MSYGERGLCAMCGCLVDRSGGPRLKPHMKEVQILLEERLTIALLRAGLDQKTIDRIIREFQSAPQTKLINCPGSGKGDEAIIFAYV